MKILDKLKHIEHPHFKSVSIEMLYTILLKA